MHLYTFRMTKRQQSRGVAWHACAIYVLLYNSIIFGAMARNKCFAQKSSHPTTEQNIPQALVFVSVGLCYVCVHRPCSAYPHPHAHTTLLSTAQQTFTSAHSSEHLTRTTILLVKKDYGAKSYSIIAVPEFSHKMYTYKIVVEWHRH